MEDYNPNQELMDKHDIGNESIKKVSKYTLRKLSTKDINPMIKILKKADIRKMKKVFDNMDISEFMQENKKNQDIENEINQISESSELTTKIGGALIFELIPIVLDVLDDCIGDFNRLLADVANIEIAELESLELDVYMNLVYDFINKEEFAGFMKVVSKFLKLGN